MRAVLVGPAYPYRGGIAHYHTLLAEALRDRGHELLLINFSRLYPELLFPGRTQYDESDRPLRVDSTRMIDSLNPLTWRRAARRARRFCPDLVVMQWWHPFFAFACRTVARGAGARTVFICHNVRPHESGVADRLLTGVGLGSGAAFVVHAASDRRALHAFLPQAAVRVAAHPTYAMFGDGATDRDTARAALGLPSGVPVLLFFGLVRAYKGLDVLLDAMPAIRRRLPGVRLVIAGEFYDAPAPYTEQIRRYGLADCVTVHNRYIPNEDVGGYFAAADLVVLPYRSATQSGIVQIAFGCGRPVVVTGVGGLPEVVHNGRTGLVVPSGVPGAIAAAVGRFFGEHLAGPMAAAIAAERDRFSWAALAETVEALAKEIGV